MVFFDFIILVAFLVFIVSRFLSHKLPKAPKNKKGNLKENTRRGPMGAEQNKVVSLKDVRQPQPQKNVKKAIDPAVLATLDGVEKIQAVDPTFEENSFLEGAKSAYGLYWQAVTDGDEETLDNLTCPRLFDEVMARVDALSSDNKHLLTRVDSLEAEIMQTHIHGKSALVEVKYATTQTQVEVKKETVQTSAKAKESAIIWVWARNLNDADPNWELEEIKNVN